MPNYDFSTLSPIDFEILSRDLLQREHRVRFESFTIGRDLGIDFRYAPSDEHKLIVQCKHYARTTFEKLAYDLEHNERSKIARLNPSRYLLTISQSLTPERKEKLMSILSPYVRASGDIYGREDLNNLLNGYPDIERQHFKLWFTSATVLEELLHARTKNLSRQALERLQRRAPLFVHHDGYIRSLQVLEKYHTCIIAGIPGIGKTTLAEILLLHYLNNDYELVVITNDITEAHHIGPSVRPRVYYYDDFLGQTGRSDKLGKNEDQQLLDFIASIKNRHNDRLIMTTREYILNQTRLRREKLDHADFALQLCIIDLGTYTRRHRAEILYNHLYFSQLPDAYKSAIVRDKNFLKLVDHPDYNPRVIETMTDIARVRSIAPGDYVYQFEAILKNPEMIWRHIFDHQLTFAARNLLLVLRTFTTNVFLSDLSEAFATFHDHQALTYHQTTTPNDFHDAVKELDSTFITLDLSRRQDVVRFQNGSIRDFLTQHLHNSPDEFAALLAKPEFFDQFEMLLYIGNAHQDTKKWFRQHSAIVLTSARRVLKRRPTRLETWSVEGGHEYQKLADDPFEGRALTLLNLAIALQTKDAEDLVIEALHHTLERIQTGQADRKVLADLLVTLGQQRVYADRFYYEQEVEMLVPDAITFLRTDPDQMEEFEPLLDIMEQWPERFNDADRTDIVKSIKRYAGDARSNLWHEPAALGAEAEALRNIADKLHVNFDAEIEAFYRDSRDEEPTHTERKVRAPTEGPWGTDDDIVALFALLETPGKHS